MAQLNPLVRGLKALGRALDWMSEHNVALYFSSVCLGIAVYFNVERERYGVAALEAACALTNIVVAAVCYRRRKRRLHRR